MGRSKIFKTSEIIVEIFLVNSHLIGTNGTATSAARHALIQIGTPAEHIIRHNASYCVTDDANLNDISSLA